jgi:hypothetical protein
MKYIYTDVHCALHNLSYLQVKSPRQLVWFYPLRNIPDEHNQVSLPS